MSARPIESVYGVPEPPSLMSSDAAISDISNHRNLKSSEGVQPEMAEPVTTQPKEAVVSDPPAEWANDELQSIASTIEELQGRLALANDRLGAVAKVETTEVEIGRLFVEAQRFSEASLANLELQIHEILNEAEAKAAQILTEATAEAHDIRQRAEKAAAASTQSARELHAAISGFSSVNNGLLRELSALNEMLLATPEERTSETAPPLGEPEGD